MRLIYCAIVASLLAGNAAAETRAEKLERHLQKITEAREFYWAWTYPWFNHWTKDGDHGNAVVQDGKLVPKAFAETSIETPLWRDEGKLSKRHAIQPQVAYFDLGYITGTWNRKEFYIANRASMTAVIRKAWKEYHAIPLFSWHMDHPCVTNGFNQAAYRYKCAEHRNTVKAIVDGEGWVKPWFDDRLEEIAAFFKGLVAEKGNRIPAILRYAHEMDGSWFWWGRDFCSPAEFIALARLEADALKAKGCAGQLLFAYTPDRWWNGLGEEGKSGYLEWYPGDEYVDVVGYDDYAIGGGKTPEERQKNFDNALAKMRTISAYAVAHGKVACLSESGKPDSGFYYEDIRRLMTAEGVKAAFFNSWIGGWTWPKTEAGMADLDRFVEAPEVKLCRMPEKIEVKECRKCPMVIRMGEDGKSAAINLARLKDDDPDEATLARRLSAAKIRARGLMNPIKPKKGDTRPLMGWSSWNAFGLGINEDVVLATAKAMAEKGLLKAGYNYVNIDDGLFNGRDENGRLKFREDLFPHGLKSTVDAIHALGFKAGIYSDGGEETCGAIYSGGIKGPQKGGVGAGLYGHDLQDCKMHFSEFGFDFIKVDYCGGQKLKLDEKKRYREIAAAIKATGRKDVHLNVCRWTFPGTWIADVAGSWRTTGDICANWKSVKHIIDLNLYLSEYIKPGHYNDLDMLEAGRIVGKIKSVFGERDSGLTRDEETTHFGMWCMMSSPLLLGCDVRRLDEESLALLTNPYVLAMSQNDLGLAGYVVKREGDAYVFVKDADERFGKARYAAFYNGSDKEVELTVKAEDLDLGGKVEAFDLVERADPGAFHGEVTVKLAPHASKFYRFDGEERLERKVYEAEAAYLNDFQKLVDPVKAGTAFVSGEAKASGGMLVRFLGKRASNYLEWRNVKIMKGGERVIRISGISVGDRAFDLQVDGGGKKHCEVKDGAFAIEVKLDLPEGVHAIRISNDKSWAPDIDRMEIL